MHTKKEGARGNVIKNAITRATIYKNSATTNGATVNGVAKEERETGRERERQGQEHLLSVCGYFNYQNVGNAIVATAVVVALVAAAAAVGKTLN